MHSELTLTIKIVSIMKQKRMYVKPAMRTVELRHTGMLMGSDQNYSNSASMSVEYDEEDI
jgi:hypothetical protein